MPSLDRDLPVLIFKIGRYPVHHAITGVLRSLGRLGITTYALTEDRFTPAAWSRYCSHRIEWTPDYTAEPEEMVERLCAIGQEIGERPLIVSTDDEAAILVAERAEELEGSFTLPKMETDLTRQLASKRGLQLLCEQHGEPMLRTCFPRTLGEVRAIAEGVEFPVVVKNVDPWLRRTKPEVLISTIVRCQEELLQLARSWQEPFHCLVQSYLPAASSEDWIVQGYVGEGQRVAFTAQKLRAWPPDTGQTAYARLAPDRELAERALRFCELVGYRGIFDIDFRYDRRNGTSYLLDFNPRVGGPFALFDNDAGIDPVRAMHLDLSGRAIPDGRQRDGQSLLVEPLALASSLIRRDPTARAPQAACPARGRLRLAWMSADDPLPFVAMAARQSWWSLRARTRRRSSPSEAVARGAPEAAPS